MERGDVIFRLCILGSGCDVCVCGAGGDENGAVMIDYRAVREDEVSVAKGDLVTVVASNLSRGYLVHRAAVTQVSPGAEGWIPSYCLHLAGAASKKPSSWAFKDLVQAGPFSHLEDEMRLITKVTPVHSSRICGRCLRELKASLKAEEGER